MTQSIQALLLCGLLCTSIASAAPEDPPKLKGLPLGQHVFLTYCAGCHGFDGLAFFPTAPSFAMGDRLSQDDAVLMRSILKGKGAMPSWEAKLPAKWLEEALAYIRRISKISLTGGEVPRVRPGYYYIFVPSGSELILDWQVTP
ncbi:MAG: cytochrome c [Candidatus Thiodiazotropha sp. (ex Cardiolucina cf. quadrata)]|nr:cytochrome c [Candidatus Thiodiazotropha sp. (ex Cardiolucina cf. quadrata)]